MSCGSGDEFWLEGVVVMVSTAKKNHASLKKMIVRHSAAEFDRHVDRMGNYPRWERVLKFDLSGSVRQILHWGSSAVQHPELFNIMLGEKHESPRQMS